MSNSASAMKITLLLCVWAAVSLPAWAEIERQYGQHVHGEGQAEVVIENAVVSVDLSLPGINLVGFEHAPRTPEQTAAIEDALAFFREGAWLQFNREARCAVLTVNAHTHGFDGAEGHAHHDHGHGDAHEEGGHHHHAHADFHVLVTAQCAQAEALRWLEFDVFDRFPGNELLRVDVLGDELAVRARLSAGRQRVSLD